MRHTRWIVGVAVAGLLAGRGFAQEPPEAPKPTPEHEVLGQWVGEWKGSGEVKPGPYGPGGPMTWTENCSWFGGGKFHVVCKSEGKGPMGPMKGIGIMGYDAAKKVYTHYGVDSTGWAGISEGTRTGEEWTFTSMETMGDKTFHSRFKMKMESPTRMSFLWQTSEDGTEWMTMMEGKTEKK